MRNKENAALEIYVHIPFCVKKCDYCDFLSGPATEERQEAYVEALLREIEAQEPDEQEQIVSVFVGGGTPSAIQPQWIGQIIDKLKEKFTFSPEAEITMEANPGTLTKEKLSIYKEHSINRISLGLQSTINEELKILGRIHTFEEFQESFRMVREAGFENINVDLMSAIPKQTYDKWVHNLRTVAELNPEHISAYSLIIEEGTPFYDYFYENELDLPDEEEEYRMYEDTAEILKEYGYEQYEISNYAKPGFACRHNIGYWKRTDYLGFGLGAASLYHGIRYHNTEDMEEYLADSSEPLALRRDVQELSRQECQEEFMFLGLRMTHGISETEFEKTFGEGMPDKYQKILEKYEQSGFLEKNQEWWCFSRKGIHVSNQILAEFLE